MTTDRDRLRATFDSVAQRYHEARPGYPDALYDELIRIADLKPGDRLLEVGCATGKATIPLAHRGFRVTCVELGAELAATAARNLAGFADVQVVNAEFEAWRPDSGSFDLVFAATAWHWIDPAVRYRKSWSCLRPGGHLAFWTAAHVFPDGGDPFFRDIQDVYDEIGEPHPSGEAQWIKPGQLPDESAEIVASGLFDGVVVRHFDWEVTYSAEGYIQLLDTFSGHIAMAPWQRERLYGEIRRRLAKRPDGRVRRHWGAVLQVARRRETSG